MSNEHTPEAVAYILTNGEVTINSMVVAAHNLRNHTPATPLYEHPFPPDDVVRQRDELLAALVEAREALQFANDSPGGVAADTIWMIHRPETLFDFMDAAIASVKESK